MHAILAPDLSLDSIRHEQERLSKERSAEVEGFVAAPTFAGARAGHVFKRGTAGLGYYPDFRGAETF